MNSKGQEVAWTNLLGAILAFIIIVGLVIFASNLLGVVSGKPEQGTLNSFEGLVIEINKFTSPYLSEEEQKAIAAAKAEGKEPPAPKPQPTEIVREYYVQKDFGLIGFDRPIIPQECGVPDKDLSSACLKFPCLCVLKSDFSVLTCKELKHVTYISVTSDASKLNLGKAHPVFAPNENLALWSACGLDPVFGVRNLNITKKQTPGKDTVDLFIEVLPKEQQVVKK